MSLSLRRLTALAGLVATVAVPVVNAPSAGATSVSHPSVVADIVANTDNYLTNVRKYFLCGTASCKKDRTALLKSAQSSMSALVAQSTNAATESVQPKYRSSVALFEADVRLLNDSYREFFVTKSTVTLSGVVGNVFYLTSFVGSDVNVMQAVEHGTTVAFNKWVEGEAATLVAMQTDAGALQASSSSTSIGIYANQLLEAEAHAMVAHANGPNRTFNVQLTTFAHNQLRISQSEILYLQHKTAPLNETQVANLNVTVSAEFAQLIKSETALVKKK
jgi:hypothetical protein